MVVVDNASTDASVEMLEEGYPWVELVRCPRNLGYAAGNNEGLRRELARETEFVALLNMDTRVDPEWLVQLVGAAEEHPDGALFGATLLSWDGKTLEFDGRQFDPVTTSGGYARSGAPESPRTRRAAYACGAGMLARTECLRRVGLFEERFFAYHEDVELSLRCWRHGHPVFNVGAAKIFHRGGGAGAGSRLRDFLGTRNMVLTWLLHYDESSWAENWGALLGNVLDADSPERVAAALASSFEAHRMLRRRADGGDTLRTYAALAAEFTRLAC